MGKTSAQRLQRRTRQSQRQTLGEGPSTTTCGKCGSDTADTTNKDQESPPSALPQDVKELVVIGAGPHAMSLVLRLLEPEADLQSEKERHSSAEDTSRMRPIPQVKRHAGNVAKGTPSALLKRQSVAKKKDLKSNSTEPSKENPPCISLADLRKSVLVLDKSTPCSGRHSGWLSQWKQNFDAIQIPVLRSPMNAHADPYDHRALEFFAAHTQREDELVVLRLLRQRDGEFRGPYQAPATSLFLDFHDLLAKSYGIEDMVQSGVQVDSIVPNAGADECSDEPYFEIHVTKTTLFSDEEEQQRLLSHEDGATPPLPKKSLVKAKRVVCAMGPMFHTGEAFWETSLREELGADFPSHRLLHGHEIVPWLLQQQRKKPTDRLVDPPLSLLIVGGGITSIHLTLLAASCREEEEEEEQDADSSSLHPQKKKTNAQNNWCKSVTLIHRSKIQERHFDLDNKWMGPCRGKFLEQFYSLDAPLRAAQLREARRGGTAPPELVQTLLAKQQQASSSSSSSVPVIDVQEDVQISHVSWDDQEEHFQVQLDDGSPPGYHDMIWLATGADHDVNLYPAFAQMLSRSANEESLPQQLPIQVVQGLPVLDSDLSWKKPPSSNEDEDDEEEEPWKGILRRRLFVMGSLAGLELGPDALNLLGARHGAVRVAKALRWDMNKTVKAETGD